MKELMVDVPRELFWDASARSPLDLPMEPALLLPVLVFKGQERMSDDRWWLRLCCML